MGRLVDWLLGLSGGAAYAVVGLLAFGEAAAFVGLLLPGEAAVLLGGVLAAQGRVSLWVMLGVACTAAVLGDSVGYEIGRHAGPRILRWRLLRGRFAGHVEHAQVYLDEHGGRAVFLGRWTSVLRALVPGLAGVARMPYRRFLAFNLAGGVAWATAFTLLGYAAGASYKTVERVAGRASLLLLVLIGVSLLIRWLGRKAARRREVLEGYVRRLATSRAGRWVTGQWGPQLRWLARRLDPRLEAGLGATVTVAAVLLGAYLVGVAVQDLLVGEELALLDGPVAAWVAGHQTAVAVTAARVVLAAFELPWVAMTAVIAALVASLLAGHGAAARLLTATALTVGSASALQRILPVTAAGTRFPSLATAVAITVTVQLTIAVGERHGWLAGTRTGTAAAVVVLLVGAAAMLDANSALSGVAGAVGLGLGMAVSVELPRQHSRRRASPALRADG